MQRNLTLTKTRPVNYKEEAEQIAHIGEVHRVEAAIDVHKSAKNEFGEMSRRWEAGERDPFMEDVAIGFKLNKVAPAIHHTDRWKRQHLITVELDKAREERHKYAIGTPEFNEANKLVVSLEHQL